MKIAKRLTTLTLALLLVISTGFSAFSAPTPPVVNMTVLGDSIASGYGLEDLLDSYGALIAKEKRYNLTNNAVPGHKTTDLLWVVCHEETAINNIKDASLISISIGGNDLLNLLSDADISILLDIAQKGENSEYIKTALNTAKENLINVCTEIRSLNPDAPIILQTLYNPIYAHPTYNSFAPMLDKLAPSLLLMLQSVSRQFDNIFIADIYSAFASYYEETSDLSVIQSDGIHPSEKGHQLIAQVITEEIDKLEEAGLIHKVADAYYLLGDTDNSGSITISDATVIQKSLAGLIVFNNSIARLCADADTDGSVTIKDATAVQKYLASLLTDTQINTYMPVYN